MTTIGRGVTITWVDHGPFHFAPPEGQGVLVHAWVDSNPMTSAALKAKVREGRVAIFLTHDHSNHVGDIAQLVADTGALVESYKEFTVETTVLPLRPGESVS